VIANTRDLNWNLNVTYDRTRMRVTDLAVPPFVTGSGAQSANIFLIAKGQIYGSMWGYRFDKSGKDLLDNPANWSGGAYGVGTPVDTTAYSVNENGLLILSSTHGTTGERGIKYVDQTGSTYYQIGDANPGYTMSFSTTANWHGFTIYALLDWVNGGQIYNQPRQWLERAEDRSGEMDMYGKGTSAWCAANPGVGAQPCTAKKATDYFSAINDANSPNQWFLEDGSYARLREVSLGYALSPSQIRSIGLSRLVRSLRLSVNGRNLITWTKYSGWDPDVHNPIGSGDPTTFRFDQGGTYPNFRVVTGMVEIGF
jgi:hypothetical protein